MLRFLSLATNRASCDIRLPDLVMQELGRSRKTSPRMDVTVDRELAARSPETEMLDLTSQLMQYLLAKACLYDFDGLAGSVCEPSLGKEDGALLGAMLRWRGPQGSRVRQEFIAILAGQGGRVNALEASKGLITPAHFSSQAAPVTSSKALFQGAHGVPTKGWPS